MANNDMLKHIIGWHKLDSVPEWDFSRSGTLLHFMLTFINS